MARYARDRGWSTIEKALIYGAYYHVLQDRIGHMATQPSRYGHGFALYDASYLLYSKPDQLEQYHELFAGTHIQYDDYQPLTFILFWGPHRWDPDPELPYGDEAFGLEFYRELLGVQIVTTWQTGTFPALSRFVEAANRYGADMTHDQLRAYLHAWAIGLGLVYGYWPQANGDQGPHSGGIVGHPEWSPDFIASEHLHNMIVHYTLLGLVPDAVFHLRQKLWQNILTHEAGVYWVSNPPAGAGADDPWPSYFESEQGLSDLWDLIPETEREYWRYQAWDQLKVKLEYLDYHSRPEATKPNWRATYSAELAAELQLADYYSTAVMDGRNGIDEDKDGLDQHARSWKAGVLGAINEIQNPSWYYRQPGVLEAGFTKDGQPCWTEIDVGLQGDPVYVNLDMDLVTYGGTRVRMMGRTQSGQNLELLPLIPSCPPPGRWTVDEPYNLQEVKS